MMILITMTTEGLGTRATWGSAASSLTAGTVGSTHTVLNGSVKPRIARGFEMLKLKARPCFHLQSSPADGITHIERLNHHHDYTAVTVSRFCLHLHFSSVHIGMPSASRTLTHTAEL